MLFGKAANRVKSRASDSDSDSSGEDSDAAGAGKVSRGYRAAMGKKPKSNRRGTGLSDSESDGSAEGWGEGGADMGGFGLNRSDDEDVSVEGAEESASVRCAPRYEHLVGMRRHGRTCNTCVAPTV